jgi:PAS domain S-box-containing protein
MTETAHARPEPSLRRDAILEAVAFAAERLLLEPDWRNAVEEVLARLGGAAEVSRSYVVENELEPDGRLISVWVAEWTEPGTPRVTDDPEYSKAPWIDSGFGRWADTFAGGEVVTGSIGDFPASERAALERHAVRSLASFPIVVEGSWWGSVGFDDCRGERDWMGPDVDALRAAASLLGAAIHRQRTDRLALDAETRYRDVIDHIPAVTYTDLPGENGAVVGFISHQIEELLGYPAERFQGDPDFWFSLIHPDDHDRIDEAARLAGRTNGRFDAEYRMRGADGREVWVHDTSEPILDPSGDIRHWQGFLTDVTERRRAEDLVREAERRFRDLVEQLPAVLYIEEVAPGTAEAVRVSYMSPKATDLLGYPPERWMESTDLYLELAHPDDVERAGAAVEQSNREGAPLDLEYRMRHADGRWVWVHEEAVLIRDDEGRPRYWQGFMLDITERRDAEDALRAAEERFRLLIERQPAITYTEPYDPEAYLNDPSSVVAYVSPQIETIGYTPEQFSAPGFSLQVVHPDDLHAVLEANREAALAGDESYKQDYRMIARDGRVLWFHDEAVLIRDAEGAPSSWQGVLVDITEQKQVEEALRTAEERYRALVEHIPAVVYVEHVGGRPEDFYIGPQVEQVFGYTVHDWTWTPDFWQSHVHSDDRERVLAADRRSEQSGDSYSVEYRFMAADGEVRWVHDEAVLMRNADGSGFWQGFLFDITERKRGEDQLRDAEERYRALVERIPAVVYAEALEADVESLYLSPQVEAIVGYTAEQWKAAPGFWKGHIHPDDLPAVLRTNAEANRSGEPYVAEYRFRRPDDTYVWLHDEAVRVFDENGEPLFWQGVLFDITERKRAEEQLREAEERFRTIVEQSPAVIYTQEIDPETGLSETTYISPRNEDLIGYTMEDIRHDRGLWTSLIHPDDRERVLAADRDSNVSGGTFSMEFRMIARDGRVIWVQDEATLVRVGNAPPYWQGFMVDISERKDAEEQLARALEVEREASRQLRALDEMKNTFLQAVSHDLRTPLAAILGLAVTLERGDVQLDPDDSRDLARRIADNARKLERLVTNLLDMDRLARGIVTPKLHPTDVGGLVRRLLAESELIGGARLHMDIQPVTIQVDTAKVERIVENLLANTVRHTPSNAQIWVSVRPQDGGVLILVEDDGPGVPPELRDTIFEPFQQGPEAPQHSPGVGVGLTLVQRFAELHGGRAWVEERPGGGASFRVLLPDGGKPTEDAPGTGEREA